MPPPTILLPRALSDHIVLGRTDGDDVSSATSSSSQQEHHHEEEAAAGSSEIICIRLLDNHRLPDEEDQQQAPESRRRRSMKDVVSFVINANRFVPSRDDGDRVVYSRTLSSMPNIPQAMNDIDVSFIEKGLKLGGALPDGARVSAIDIKPLSLNGFLSDVGRCHITYEGVVDNDEDGMTPTPPARLVIKLAGAQSEAGEEIARENNLYHMEAEFFRKFAEYASVGTPHCYAAFEDSKFGNVILLLEDLQDRDGLYFVNQLEGIRRKEIMDMAVSLSALHAQHWSWEGAAGLPAWLPHCTDITVRNPCNPAHMERYLSSAFVDEAHCASRGVGGEVRKACLQITERADEIREAMKRGALTLCHNDARSDNVFFGDRSGAPGGVVLLDWQIMSTGVGAADLAFVASNSVTDEPPSEARDKAYVKAYWESLTSRGVDPDRYSFDACWHDYLLGIAWTYACLTVFIEFGEAEQMLEDPLCRAMHDRSMLAVEGLRVHELETFARH